MIVTYLCSMDRQEILSGIKSGITEKREHPDEKSKLHPRNKHRKRYDFQALTAACPELTSFVFVNAWGDESIDFFNPEAVKLLNKALLKQVYGIDSPPIPADYLCPPIPGRADYIHHAADLLSSTRKGLIPKGPGIRCLDIGTGAHCIYPVLGTREYGWSFVATDIDAGALKSAGKFIALNPQLPDKIELRLQPNPADIFTGIIQKEERFDLSLCNPPFHASAAEALRETQRKLNNLRGKKMETVKRNFGGQAHELWCAGGEEQFIRTMIKQSLQFSQSCTWFTTLVSKESSLKTAYTALKNAEAKTVRTIPMGQGNKTSRILAWTFIGNSSTPGMAIKPWK